MSDEAHPAVESPAYQEILDHLETLIKKKLEMETQLKNLSTNLCH